MKKLMMTSEAIFYRVEAAMRHLCNARSPASKAGVATVRNRHRLAHRVTCSAPCGMDRIIPVAYETK
jgi:hypothetical protein